MKRHLIAISIAFLIISFPISLCSQSQPRLNVAVFLPTPVPGHHIEEFSVYSSIGISSLSAIVNFGPMNQIQPGGQLTVFPNLLAPEDLLKDSHFLFDTSSATILSQSENTMLLQAEVQFNANYPTTFKLAQAVVADGHTPYSATISGTLLDGQNFYESTTFVPEPSVFSLGILGAVLIFFFYRHQGTR